ncbi:hypothetical protein S245_007920, partial [Arachis hypogaea]
SITCPIAKFSRFNCHPTQKIKNKKPLLVISQRQIPSLKSLSPKNHRFTFTHSPLSTSFTAVPHSYCQTQRQPTTEVVTRHSPLPILCLIPALPVSAPLFLLRLCRPVRLGSAVPCLSLLPPRASSASAYSVVILQCSV